MRVRLFLAFLRAFARARWRWRRGARADLLRWQARQLERYLRGQLSRFPFYAAQPVQAFGNLPIVDKALVHAQFAGMNGYGISREQALRVARVGEQTRDFRTTLPDSITVGLSSGTSGQPSMFLVSEDERARWAGAILGKLLRTGELLRIANPFAPPLKIAFFLRANSNLYTTLGGTRIRFQYFDLLKPSTALLEALQAFAPDILVAPASVLGVIARSVLDGRIRCQLAHVISVAETLEADDRALIRAAWRVSPDEVYQATEGLLGVSCEAGRVHLSEEFMQVETEWLDADRFVPVVTDFSRTTQAIVRYRLDDVLLTAPDGCPCGRPTRSLRAIEGRCDDVFWLPARTATGAPLAVYPDVIRRAMALAQSACGTFDEYRLVQHDRAIDVRLRGSGNEAVAAALSELWDQLGVHGPRLNFRPWIDDSGVGTKRRRIRRVGAPSPAANAGHPLKESKR